MRVIDFMDYIFRWLALKFLPKEEQPKENGDELTTANFQEKNGDSELNEAYEKHIYQTQSDAPPCHECGAIMVRSGSCYKCLSCGATSGCS